MDVINTDGFDSDPGNDDETSNYMRRSVRIRARYDGKVYVFTMSQGTGPTGPNCGMEAGPSRSSGPITRSKKRKNTGTNDDSQVCSSILDAHDKGDLYPWVLDIKHYSYKFLSEKIFDQVRFNLDIPVKVVELQSTNPNTTVKIIVERNSDPSLPTRGPFPSQVLAAVGLDSNNEIYPLAYAMVEAKSKSSCDRQNGIISAIKTVFRSVEHRYCLRHIHENMKQGWCGQAYKDLLWRTASTTSVKEFEKCMLEIKKMNPKEHEWLNKIPP
ncbi:hypothetical protein Tco_0723006 [Tanacetum coccineum]